MSLFNGWFFFLEETLFLFFVQMLKFRVPESRCGVTDWISLHELHFPIDLDKL